MNRPKKENYYIDFISTEPFNKSYIGRYVAKLDKYCNELEKDIFAYQKLLDNELDKALNETFNQHIEELLEIKNKKIAELEEEVCKYQILADKAINKIIELEIELGGKR